MPRARGGQVIQFGVIDMHKLPHLFQPVEHFVRSVVAIVGHNKDFVEPQRAKIGDPFEDKLPLIAHTGGDGDTGLCQVSPFGAGAGDRGLNPVKVNTTCPEVFYTVP
jgi:hypothetical protein